MGAEDQRVRTSLVFQDHDCGLTRAYPTEAKIGRDKVRRRWSSSGIYVGEDCGFGIDQRERSYTESAGG